MNAAELAAWTGRAWLALVAAGAVLVGARLLRGTRFEETRAWLGLRLLASAGLIAVLAGLSLGGLDTPRGSWHQLAGFALGVAGASLYLLDLPFAVAQTREDTELGLASWGALVPLLLPVGFLGYAWMHWPSTSLAPARTPVTEWAGWPGYDAVEDAAGFLAAGCILLAALLVTLTLAYRSLSGSAGVRRRARRMLAQAWGPVLVWIGALGLVWIGLSIQDPPASSALVFAQELLLDGPVAFSLTILGPLRWGLERASASPVMAPGRAGARSNRS